MLVDTAAVLAGKVTAQAVLEVASKSGQPNDQGTCLGDEQGPFLPGNWDSFGVAETVQAQLRVARRSTHCVVVE